jgi:hypothetical protein
MLYMLLQVEATWPALSPLHACRFQQRMAIALQPVELTRIRAEDLVHIGDLVQLCNAHTPAVLACDIEDRVRLSILSPFSCTCRASLRDQG